MIYTCAYINCGSDSRKQSLSCMDGVSFVTFPSPVHNTLKCKRWVKACGDFSFDRVTCITRVCTKHFIGGKGPTPEHPDPISALVTYDTKKAPKKRQKSGTTFKRHQFGDRDDDAMMQHQNSEMRNSLSTVYPSNQDHSQKSAHKMSASNLQNSAANPATAPTTTATPPQRSTPPPPYFPQPPMLYPHTQPSPAYMATLAAQASYLRYPWSGFGNFNYSGHLPVTNQHFQNQPPQQIVQDPHGSMSKSVQQHLTNGQQTVQQQYTNDQNGGIVQPATEQSPQLLKLLSSSEHSKGAHTFEPSHLHSTANRCESAKSQVPNINNQYIQSTSSSSTTPQIQDPLFDYLTTNTNNNGVVLRANTSIQHPIVIDDSNVEIPSQQSSCNGANNVFHVNLAETQSNKNIDNLGLLANYVTNKNTPSYHPYSSSVGQQSNTSRPKSNISNNSSKSSSTTPSQTAIPPQLPQPPAAVPSNNTHQRVTGQLQLKINGLNHAAVPSNKIIGRRYIPFNPSSSNMTQITRVGLPLWKALDKLLLAKFPLEVWKHQRDDARKMWSELDQRVGGFIHDFMDETKRNEHAKQAFFLIQGLTYLLNVRVRQVHAKEVNDLWTNTLDFAQMMGKVTKRAVNLKHLPDDIRISHGEIRIWWFYIVLNALAINPYKPEPWRLLEIESCFCHVAPTLRKLNLYLNREECNELQEVRTVLNKVNETVANNESPVEEEPVAYEPLLMNQSTNHQAGRRDQSQLAIKNSLAGSSSLSDSAVQQSTPPPVALRPSIYLSKESSCDLIGTDKETQNQDGICIDDEDDSELDDTFLANSSKTKGNDNTEESVVFLRQPKEEVVDVSTGDLYPTGDDGRAVNSVMSDSAVRIETGQIKQENVSATFDQFRCPVCRSPCGSEFCLLGHLNVLHTELSHVTCLLCKEKINKFNLFRHLHGVHLATKAKYVCGAETGGGWKCSFTAQSSSLLFQHVDLNHAELTCFDCYKCGSYFSSNSDLVCHLLEDSARVGCNLGKEDNRDPPHLQNSSLPHGSSSSHEGPHLLAVNCLQPSTRIREFGSPPLLERETMQQLRSKSVVILSVPMHDTNIEEIKHKESLLYFKVPLTSDKRKRENDTEDLPLPKKKNKLQYRQSSSDQKVPDINKRPIDDSYLDLKLNCPECDEVLCGMLHFSMHLATHDQYKDPDRLVPAMSSDTHPRCGICGWFANGQMQFEKHLDRHLKEKNFVCLKCNKDFDREDLLNSHCKTDHPGQSISFYERGDRYEKLCQAPNLVVLMNPSVKLTRC